MRKIYLTVLALALIGSSILLQARAEDSEDKFKNILEQTTNTILASKQDKDEQSEVPESGQIIFKAKKSELWVKDKSADEKEVDGDVEIALPGKLYHSPKEIPMIEKKDVDRKTLENTVASVFSANRAGELDWIIDNFTDKDKVEIKTLFANKKLLEESRSDAEKIISIYLIGQVDYKDSVLALIEQDNVDGRRLKGSLACKKTEKGWKVTNEFSSDKTFDIIFAALSSGKFSLKEKN